jgi:hypothetical protein
MEDLGLDWIQRFHSVVFLGCTYTNQRYGIEYDFIGNHVLFLRNGTSIRFLFLLGKISSESEALYQIA